MKIKFYAHASFRLEADGLAVITDPYTPGPQNSGFDPILARAGRLLGMTETKSRAAVLTEISLIFAAVFWGLNFAATKYAADSIPPLVIVAFRFTGGGLLLLLILRLLEPESRPGRKDLILMAALGCFGVAIAQSGFTFGVSLTSAASTGFATRRSRSAASRAW